MIKSHRRRYHDGDGGGERLEWVAMGFIKREISK